MHSHNVLFYYMIGTSTFVLVTVHIGDTVVRGPDWQWGDQVIVYSRIEKGSLV